MGEPKNNCVVRVQFPKPGSEKERVTSSDEEGEERDEHLKLQLFREGGSVIYVLSNRIYGIVRRRMGIYILYDLTYHD